MNFVSHFVWSCINWLVSWLIVKLVVYSVSGIVSQLVRQTFHMSTLTRIIMDIKNISLGDPLIKWNRLPLNLSHKLYFFRKYWFPSLTPIQNERFSVQDVTWAFCWRRLLKGPKSPCDCAIGLLVIYWLVRRRSMWAWKTSSVPCDWYCWVSYMFYEHWNYSFPLNCLGPLGQNWKEKLDISWRNHSFKMNISFRVGVEILTSVVVHSVWCCWDSYNFVDVSEERTSSCFRGEYIVNKQCEREVSSW
jgi:hypothetical protein